MNKYFVSDLLPGSQYAAGSQREDIEAILLEEGYSAIKFPIPSLNIFSRLRLYSKVFSVANNLTKPACVFFHFPVRSRAFRYFHSILKKRGVRTIAYEIDLEGLRDNDTGRLAVEMNQLSKFDIIITQNETKKKTIEKHTGHAHVITHEMHDYPGVKCRTFPERRLSNTICFAGNLAKAPFIHQLANLGKLSFNIYGDTENIPTSANTVYKGKADPRELPCIMEGSFGLVWDGSSIQSGMNEGNYLRYNIPHKIALYIMAQLPLIVWKESAVSGWVEQHQIGISVSSLYELMEQIEKITDNDYNRFISQMKDIRQKMSDGFYLKTAIRAAEQLLT